MYFASLHDLLYMNGHGAYVWGAYGISFTVLCAMAWQSLSRHAQLCREIRQQTAQREQD